jgi:hypothetical protein
VFICLVAVKVASSPEKEARVWISHWAAAFRQCHSLGEIDALSAKERRPIYTRRFPDGFWVAAVNEYNCSAGAGFNAAVFYDSTGRVQVDRSHHFCGFEGLESDLARISATSFGGFYAGLPCHLVESR